MNKAAVRASLLAIFVIVSTSFLTADSVQGRFEKSYSVNGPVELQVLTRSGDISVASGPAGTVTIHGKIHVSDRWLTGNRQGDVSEIEKNPPIAQNGNSIRIDYLNYHDISVDYEITAPPDTVVETHSGSGDQRMSGLSGKLTLESGSGDMKLRNIGSEIQVHTGSGDVDALDIAGPFSVECGSGDVRVDVSGSGGDSRVRTGSGNVELHGIKGGLRAESGSGDLTISGAITGPWEIRTSSGNIEIDLGSGASFELDATAGSGNIDVDGPMTMTVQGDLRKVRHSIHGQVGSGGPLMTVHTGSGDVHIH
jgi:hypothetical protein